MQALLDPPAVQAGLAPFMVALVTAELFRRIKLSGLAIIAGFVVTIYLVSDFTFDPLTSSRKIVLLGLISASLGLLLSLIRLPWFSFVLPILGGAAAIWTAQGILQNQEAQVALLWGAGCASYVAILVWGMDMLENESPRAIGAATSLGIGTGGTALVGTSALLGQFGLALGSAAAALLLIQMISNQVLPTGRAFTLPLATIAGLTGCVAVLSAELPWYALLILACIPIVARMVRLPNRSVQIQSLLLTLLTLALAVCAIYITWRETGYIPF